MNIPAYRGRKRPLSSPQRRKAKKALPLSHWHPRWRQFTDWIIIGGSVLLCLFLLPSRFPGMELLGISPNWLLIWVVAWSVKRNAFQGIFAGVVLGLLQDAITSPSPTHALSLGLVGFLTGLFPKQRFIQEDFISIALIVFGMTVVSETIFASEMILSSDRSPEVIWTYYQQVTLAAAILNSLWAPVVYFPLNLWWQRLKLAAQK